jgi:protein phosphatase
MGTTATALVLRPDGAWVAHVGDSRAYRIRDGHIEQLSFDHSMVWEYARRQHMDPETVQGIPSNVIFRSLGPEPLVPIDIEGVHPLRDGDVFLVCSDGLSGRVSDPELGAIASVLPPKEACRFLVDLANLRGGPDNITVVIVRVGSHMATPPPAAKPWYRRFPWPLVALLLGVMLAGTAVALIIEGNMVWANLCFALAVVAIVGGLGGLAAYQARENRRLSEEAARPRPKIHRSLECRIEPPLLDRWARSDQGLVQQAREKNWEPNWAAHDELVHDAQDHLAQGDLVHAFRSFCRAMQTLMTAMQSQRGKTEVFHPVWDKHPISSQPAGQGDNGREAPSYRCEQCGKVVPPPADRSIPRCCEQPMKPM